MNLLPVQNHLRSALGSYPPLQALVGERIYDRVPDNPVFPYVTIGVADGTEDFISDCAIDWEVSSEVHVWSRSPGYVEGKQIADACNGALADRYPALNGYRVGWFGVVGQRWTRDPDGLTSHGILEYLAHYGPA